MNLCHTSVSTTNSHKISPLSDGFGFTAADDAVHAQKLRTFKPK